MTYYNTGAASVAAGGKVVSFTGAGLGSKEFPFIKPGELFFDPAQPLVPGQRIASVDYEAQTATLWVEWPGISMVSAPYEVRLVDDAVRSTRQSRRYIEMAGQLTALGIQPNAFGEFTDRAAFDDAAKGFIFLSLDGDGVTGVWTLYTKLSATSGDWSAGQQLEGREGRQGNPGLIGDWRGTWAAGTYNELEAVEHNGSAYIANTTTIEEPPHADWDLVARRGDEGLTAYEVAVAEGFVGDEAAWLASLAGNDGLGVPPGGTTGQMLRKASSADGDTVWGDTGALAGFRNKIINPLGSNNQRTKSGTVILASGAYGHDRFKAGAGGCTYTFSTNNGVTTFNITAGTLQQVVEAGALEGGTFFLGWEGTAQGRINGGAYGASGVPTAIVSGGADVTLEWGIGTLSKPQFERAWLSDFNARHPQQELALCQRYYCAGEYRGVFRQYNAAFVSFGAPLYFPVEMRAAPSVSLDPPIVNWEGAVPTLGTLAASYPSKGGAAAVWNATGGVLGATGNGLIAGRFDAEL